MKVSKIRYAKGYIFRFQGTMEILTLTKPDTYDAEVDIPYIMIDDGNHIMYNYLLKLDKSYRGSKIPYNRTFLTRNANDEYKIEDIKDLDSKYS